MSEHVAVRLWIFQSMDPGTFSCPCMLVKYDIQLRLHQAFSIAFGNKEICRFLSLSRITSALTSPAVVVLCHVRLYHFSMISVAFFHDFGGCSCNLQPVASFAILDDLLLACHSSLSCIALFFGEVLWTRGPPSEHPS